MIVQGLSGVAKALSKINAKTAVNFLAPTEAAAFPLGCYSHGIQKNAIKGLVFLPLLRFTDFWLPYGILDDGKFHGYCFSRFRHRHAMCITACGQSANLGDVFLTIQTSIGWTFHASFSLVSVSFDLLLRFPFVSMPFCPMAQRRVTKMPFFAVKTFMA